MKQALIQVPKRALRSLIAVFVGVMVIAGSLTLLRLFYNDSENRRILETGIDDITVNSPVLRITLMSRSGSSVSARCRFYNQDAYEVASFERSWSGTELALEGLVIPILDKYIFFPAWLDTELPGRGIELFPYYSRDGFPLIYDQRFIADEFHSALRSLFAAVRRADAKNDSGGTPRLGVALPAAYRYSVRLSDAELGAVYACVLNEKGEPVFIRE